MIMLLLVLFVPPMLMYMRLLEAHVEVSVVNEFH